MTGILLPGTRGDVSWGCLAPRLPLPTGQCLYRCVACDSSRRGVIGTPRLCQPRLARLGMRGEYAESHTRVTCRLSIISSRITEVRPTGLSGPPRTPLAARRARRPTP